MCELQHKIHGRALEGGLGVLSGDLGHGQTAGGANAGFLIWHASLMAGWRGPDARFRRVLHPWETGLCDRDRGSLTQWQLLPAVAFWQASPVVPRPPFPSPPCQLN